MFRDTTISAKSKQREVIILLLCFAVAFILNVTGIIFYKSPAREIFTQLHIVLLIAVILYLTVVILRVLYYLLSRLWLRRK